MISQQTLKGNLVLQDYSTAFTLNQGDKGVPFKVELLENGTPYILQSTDTVSIEWLKPNGKPFLQDGDIIYGTNYIEIITPEAVSQYSGSGTFNIIISDGDVRKGTIRREYKVVATSMTPGSVSEDVITDAMTELRELNSTLAATIQTGNLDNYAKKTYVNKEVELINSSLEEKSNDIDVLKRNRIFNCSVFGNPNCFTSNQPYLLSDLQNLKKIGVDSIMITARTKLKDDGVSIELTQDIDTLLYIYSTALSLGLKTSAIRVSASSYNNSGYDFITNWDTWNIEYTTIVNSVLEAFKDKDIPYFIPFNETEKLTVDYDSTFTKNPYTNTGTAQETYVVNTLNNVKSYGFKTGINTASIKYANFVTDEIAEACDVLFINSYFQIGTAGVSMGLANRVETINSMVDSMYTPVQEKFAGKDLFIGECGIKSYWEAMLSASAWDFSDYDEVADGKPIEYYWESIFNSSLQSKVKGIGIWFHEDIKEDNLEFFHRYIGRWE